MTEQSLYQGGQRSPNLTAIQARQWQAVRDLIDFWRVSLAADLETTDAVRDDYSGIAPPGRMKHLLYLEARRVTSTSNEANALVQYTSAYLAWASRATRERNRAVLARFAVELAYDHLLRAKFTQHIADSWPTRWRGGKKRFPDDTGFQPALRGHEFDKLMEGTAYSAKLPHMPLTTVKPFEGLSPTYSWMFDPLRPPLSAVRAAASLIERHVLVQRPDVLMVEPGHRVAGQALSIFLPLSNIYLSSSMFSALAPDGRPATFPAVVVNLPHAREIAAVKDALDRHDYDRPASNRWECDKFWNWSTTDRGLHTEPLIKKGLEHLAPRGILIVPANDESGLVHDALGLLRAETTLRQVPVSAARHGMATFRYRERPWGLHGALPASGRTLSVWERQS